MTAPPLSGPIVLAHAAYRLGDACAAKGVGQPFVEVRDLAALEGAVAEAEVLVVSGLWRHALLERAPRLRFIQSVSAGTDQFPKDALRERGIRLASAQGGNERAVAEHALALMLGLTRHLPQALRHQAAATWRPMIADPAAREQELGGRTLLVIGLGRIGTRIARLGQAFDMRVIGLRRRPLEPGDPVEAVFSPDRLHEALGQADVVALACPLTPETEGLIDAAALAAMRPGALLINVARGRVVDQDALARALTEGRIAGAGLDCFREEPLPADAPFWGMPNVIVTPHSAGETSLYEGRVIDLLVENLGRLRRGEELVNPVV
ncbi:D-2-hydroxyacid dehydrogenase [Methylobacterium terricola]|uniref:D-2-hydroxyacid dehydrogenase n=1 Tax=Methylobacterium terricola TaxID=2583531 RepID=A0A5C4LKL2_9HYPH|nr:D-2-hydroxyacid dehydrogenase [Methylobacterium terricola]TNC14225.1 D-2-hydroxyacid dehydrogenase [Methylobacterium terricola]